MEIVETTFSVSSSWTMFAIVVSLKYAREEFVLIQLVSSFFLSRLSMNRLYSILMAGDLKCKLFGTDNAVFGVNWSYVLEPEEHKHSLRIDS